MERIASPAAGRRHAAGVPSRLTSTLLGAAALGLYAPTLLAAARVWASDSYYSYGFLVPLFAAYALWIERDRLAGLRLRWNASGVPAIVGGLAVLWAGLHAGSLTLQVVSLPVVLAGMTLCLVGTRGFAPVAFPLGFLLLMAPLPAALVPPVSLRLQMLAAVVTERVLVTLGIPVAREGLLVHLRGLTLAVTEDCNGLRFLLAMLVLGVAIAWATSRGVAGGAALVGVALVVGVLANLVRVSGTAVLADRWGIVAATGFWHLLFGKVVYAAMLGPFMAAAVWTRPRRTSGA